MSLFPAAAPLNYGWGYVDAGYAIALTVLALYAVSLILRRRRLERAAAVLDRDQSPPAGPPGASPSAGPSPAGSAPAATVSREPPVPRVPEDQ